MTIVMALAVVVVLALARVSTPLSDAAMARTAADAAALAGAADGRSAAHALAVRNGGTLVMFTTRPDGVEVRVRVGSAVATARASADIEWRRPPRAG